MHSLACFAVHLSYIRSLSQSNSSSPAVISVGFRMIVPAAEDPWPKNIGGCIEGLAGLVETTALPHPLESADIRRPRLWARWSWACLRKLADVAPSPSPPLLPFGVAVTVMLSSSTVEIFVVRRIVRIAQHMESHGEKAIALQRGLSREIESARWHDFVARFVTDR